MVTHIVIFHWKPGVTQAQVHAFGQAMTRMAEEVGNLDIHHGPSEPWRNGIVEKFNDHYRQKFLEKVTMASIPQLRQESLAF